MNFCPITFRLRLWILAATVCCCGPLAGDEKRAPADSVDGWAELAAQINRNVESGTRLMAVARAEIEYFDENIRAEFSLIEKSVRSAETRLRRSLGFVESASPENWARARASLAANYEAYAQAVARAERLITLAPASARREQRSR
jgi:hypothetical protein